MKGAGAKDKEGLETSSSAFSITSIAGSLERWEGKTVEVEAGATASDCRLTTLPQRGHRFMVARRRLPRAEGGRTLELPEVRPNKALRNEEATAKRDSGLVLDLDFRFSFLFVLLGKERFSAFQLKGVLFELAGVACSAAPLERALKRSKERAERSALIRS